MTAPLTTGAEVQRTTRRALALVVALTVLGVTACTTAPEPGLDTPDGSSLADGDYSGYVVGFDGRAITFDPAERLADDDAANGFRMDNPDDATLLLGVAPAAGVTLIDNVSIEHREVDLATFGAFLDGERPDWAYGSPESFFAEIEMHEGQVLRIAEVYLP